MCFRLFSYSKSTEVSKQFSVRLIMFQGTTLFEAFFPLFDGDLSHCGNFQISEHAQCFWLKHAIDPVTARAFIKTARRVIGVELAAQETRTRWGTNHLYDENVGNASR
jgi:hypothetical protein